jgi:hypothetical protein
MGRKLWLDHPRSFNLGPSSYNKTCSHGVGGGGQSLFKNSSPIHIFHRRPHNDTRINASHVSSFNRILQFLFTQFGQENPLSHIVVLAKPKLQSVPSQSCRVEIAGVIGIWNCPLECQDWSPPMLLFANYSHCIFWHAIFGEAFTMKGGNFAKHIFVKCPKTQQKKTFLTVKMAFDKCWRLEYPTLGATPTDGILLLIAMALNCGAYGNLIGNPLSCFPHAFLPSFLHP